MKSKVAGLAVRGLPSNTYAAPIIVMDEELKLIPYSNGIKEEYDDCRRYNNDFNREGYDGIVENRFLKVTDNPLSAFSIDVDAASYSNIRRMLNHD